MNKKRKILTIEMIVLFTGIPIILLIYQTPAIKLFILLSGTIGALAILYKGRIFLKEYFSLSDKKILWRKFVIKLVMVSALIMLLGLMFREEYFFKVPYQLAFIPLIIISYPLISVLPQEIIFRLFFFERYGSLFRSKYVLIFINSLLFAFMHIIYRNPIAVSFTFFGGLLFCSTYRNSRSILLTIIEHTVYGFFIFLSGFGQYFLTDNMFKMLFHTR